MIYSVVYKCDRCGKQHEDVTKGQMYEIKKYYCPCVDLGELMKISFKYVPIEGKQSVNDEGATYAGL